MRRRIGIYGATEEALQLIPLLLANPEVEIAGLHDPDPTALRGRLASLPPATAEALRGRVFAEAEALTAETGLYALIAAGDTPELAPALAAAAERGVQIVTPLVARLLWGYARGGDEQRKSELLQALHEVVESYNLTVDADELFRRMLEIAIGVTQADGGSLMLLDPESAELRVRVAVGVEPELWPKIRVRIGEGIAGRVAQEARPLRLRGKADRKTFNIVRERLDVESALSVPLIHDGRILGVLNLHHATRADAFTESDLDFTEQLARLDAQIIAQAQEHEDMRTRAARYEAVRRVREILDSNAPLPERLANLCRAVVELVGGGIANLYLYDLDQGDLYLAASSLERSAFGEELRIAVGQGVDGEVARSRQPAFLRGPNGALAYAALPLVSSDRLSGVLAVQVGNGATRAREGDAALLEIAEAAADEIDALRREARVQTRATKLAAINEAGIRMMSIDDPAEVLRHGTSAAAMVLEADHAVLRLRDEETGRYAIRSYFGSADGRLQELLFRLDKRASVGALKRRGLLTVRDVAADPELSEFAPDLHSLLCAPMQREGEAVGTLAVYDKMSSDRFAAGSFTEEDARLFRKFVSHLERALANAQFIWRARQFRNIDDETGLPSAGYLEQRFHEELTRAGGRETALLIARCRIDNLDELLRAQDLSITRRIMQRTAESLRENLRDFDVAARTAEDELTILLPEPGYAAADRISELARAVAEDVSKADDLNDPVRVALSFGYAIHPEDGADAATLLEAAATPRIRMV
ncbi:MAG: GAF domain-containing protein [Myxococcota bacterium]